jgi:hypothetical protein
MTELTKEMVDKALAERGIKRGEESNIESTGEGAHRAAMKLQVISQKVSSDKYEPTMHDVMMVLDAFYNWYGQNFEETVKMARNRDGFARLKTDISVTPNDYEIIKQAWAIIKEKCGEILTSKQFSTEKWDKSYPKKTKNLVQVIDEVVATPQEDDKARLLPFIEFDGRVFAGFYGKKEDAQELGVEPGLE